MFEYDFKRFQRRCCKTNQEFKPGDVYYSALIEDGEQFVRMDFSARAWEGPPPGAIGWWRCQMAAQNPNRVYWAPNSVLLDYFGKLALRPEKAELYYLMALVLMRKKLLQLVENRRQEDGTAELLVNSARNKQDYRVPVCEPAPQRLQELQTELCEQLFTDQPVDPMDAESAKTADAN
jgi:hypothetical protein